MRQKIWFLEHRQGFTNTPGQCISGITGEFNSVCPGRTFGDIDHGVIQSAGDPDDGNGAVTQAVHLVKPTGFESGRHEEEITTGLDAVGKALVPTNMDGDL